MELRTKPDFKLVCKIANETLLCCEKQTSFPIRVSEVIKEISDINIMSFSDARKMGIEPTKMGSSSSVFVELEGYCFLFYNEKETRERITFDCAHELGHYKLEHDMERLEELRKTNMDLFNKLYAVCEVEANFFAAQLLMPEQVIIELNKRGRGINKYFLMDTFKVSEPAAIKRIETLKKAYNWNYYQNNKSFNYDDIIIKKFMKLIVFLAPNNYSYEEEYEMQQKRDRWLQEL